MISSRSEPCRRRCTLQPCPAAREHWLHCVYLPSYSELIRTPLSHNDVAPIHPHLSPLPSVSLTLRSSVVPNPADDEDIPVSSSHPHTSGTPAIPQTPLVSQLDRDQLDAPLPPPPAAEGRHNQDHSRAFSVSGTKLPQKPVRRESRGGGRTSADWSRASIGGGGGAGAATSGSRSFLPVGLFSGFSRGGGGKNGGEAAKGRYEPVGPMRAGKAPGEKTYVELDMDEYAEGLRLTVDGDDDDDDGEARGSKRRRASASTGVGAFVSACSLQRFPARVLTLPVARSLTSSTRPKCAATEGRASASPLSASP